MIRPLVRDSRKLFDHDTNVLLVSNEEGYVSAEEGNEEEAEMK